MLLLARFFSRIKKKCKRKLYYNFDQYNNVYHFSLTDESNTLIDLNGLNIVFTILVFRVDNLYELIDKYQQYTLRNK